MVKLLQLLHDHDHLLAELVTKKGILDEDGVFVAIADNQALRLLVDRERRDQLRLAARLDAELKLLARRHDLLHDFAELVYFDRENSAVSILIARFLDGGLEGVVDGLHAVAQQILESEDQRKGEPALPCLRHDFHYFDGRARDLGRQRVHISLFVDREIAGAPAVNIVERCGGLDVPLVRHEGGILWTAGGFATACFLQMRADANPRAARVAAPAGCSTS